MAKKTINSRQKGAAGERELAGILREYGYDDSKRGQQYCGADGSADVVGLPGIHMECKRVERLNLYEAIEQAISDSGADDLPDGYDLPAAFHRKNRHEWLVTMRIKEWTDIYHQSKGVLPIRTDYMDNRAGGVYDWLSESIERRNMDRSLFSGEPAAPVIFHRKAKKIWLATMRLEDWIKLYREYRV